MTDKCSHLETLHKNAKWANSREVDASSALCGWSYYLPQWPTWGLPSSQADLAWHGSRRKIQFYESALDRLLFVGSDLFLQQPDSICEEWGLHRKWQGLEEVVWMTTLLGQKAISWYCAFFQYGLNASGTGLPECWPSELNYQPLQSFRHSHSFVSS